MGTKNTSDSTGIAKIERGVSKSESIEPLGAKVRYVAVQHRWWMKHLDWEIKELKSDNQIDAEIEAGYWNDRNNKQFSHATTVVLEIYDNEQMINGRKLTLWERLRGRL